MGGSPELIGRGLDEAAAVNALDEALELGVKLFDTAERYANGASEAMIGRWLASHSQSTVESVRIATKIAPPWVDGPPGQFDLAYIEEKFSGSLDRLGVECVELLFIHAPDPETPIEQTLEALEAIRASGRSVHLGACNLTADDLIQALEAAARLEVVGFEVIQNGYSLLTSETEAEVRSICTSNDLPFTPYSPLAGGVLTGKYERGKPPDPDSRVALRGETAADLTEATHDAIDQLRARAIDEYGVECGALALAWLSHHPDITAPVVGPSRSSPRLSLTRQALDVELTEAGFDEIGQWFLQTAKPN
jgi:aryl-alcohol dehydrogenase-like predicted oxidoreductase